MLGLSGGVLRTTREPRQSPVGLRFGLRFGRESFSTHRCPSLISGLISAQQVFICGIDPPPPLLWHVHTGLCSATYPLLSLQASLSGMLANAGAVELCTRRCWIIPSVFYPLVSGTRRVCNISFRLTDRTVKAAAKPDAEVHCVVCAWCSQSGTVRSSEGLEPSNPPEHRDKGRKEEVHPVPAPKAEDEQEWDNLDEPDTEEDEPEGEEEELDGEEDGSDGEDSEWGDPPPEGDLRRLLDVLDQVRPR